MPMLTPCLVNISSYHQSQHHVRHHSFAPARPHHNDHEQCNYSAPHHFSFCTFLQDNTKTTMSSVAVHRHLFLLAKH